jgi:2-oxoisovalerate dehydrogenase E1 component
MKKTQATANIKKYTAEFWQEAVTDYRVAILSREASLLGRKEVLGGKAKFGIFGDGKEVAQVAMARSFRKGDFRSGYYRDQTFVFAAGLGTVQQFFAQLYAHADETKDIFSAGRQMNAHFATPLVDKSGNWLNHTEHKNISADISPTAGQMSRALGLAFASKKYRNIPELGTFSQFSNLGNEVSFCTIGDASTSEGIFWETINAAGVLQVPLATFVWDDGYGISVPIHYQTTKSSISEALAGFQTEKDKAGIEIKTVKAWDYAALRQCFSAGVELCRNQHQPVLFHVQEVTQPQGHSTSGSHERYKSAERLQWEKDADCLVKMREFLLENEAVTIAELEEMETSVKAEVKKAARAAWDNFNYDVNINKTKALQLLSGLNQTEELQALQVELQKALNPTHLNVVKICRQAIFISKTDKTEARAAISAFINEIYQWSNKAYHSHLYSENQFAASKVAEIKPIYTATSPVKNGFEILNGYFEQLFSNNPAVLAFGEDVGKIGDVNQGFANLQAKFGEERIFDTGIREWSIIGQAIGLAMRGLRPIAEIQYLDYLIYALSPLSDDLATLRYRSNAMQQAPAIIRTRGHRLEGIWHSGSPIAMMLNALRGICILCPRDMTRAVGFYNTMLKSNDPAIVIECLNGYRLKEQMPDNLGDFTVPIGQVEILETGTDITLLTYGSCVRVAQEAIKMLKQADISVELIDAQSLLPFDLRSDLRLSVQKTNRLVILDEDVQSGASAYLLDQILVKQNAYMYLDSAPVTISAASVRPAFGSDADYFIKPNTEDIFEQIYNLMQEARPNKYVAL